MSNLIQETAHIGRHLLVHMHLLLHVFNVDGQQTGAQMLISAEEGR